MQVAQLIRLQHLQFSCSLQFADFSLFSVWFLVFAINTSVFSVLVCDMVFGFQCLFCSIWNLVSLRFQQQLILNVQQRNAKVTERNVWQTRCNVKGPGLWNDAAHFALAIIWSDSNVPPMPAKTSKGRSNCGLCYVFL